MFDRFQVVPAAYVVLRRRGAAREEVLLQLRRGTGYMDGYWATAAAGHVEDGESAFQAGCREAAEELGIRIESKDLVALTAMHRTAGNRRPIDERVDFFFQCRQWTGEPQLIETEKAAALEWFALDELPQPVVPHELYVLERLARDGLPAVVTFGSWIKKTRAGT